MKLLSLWFERMISMYTIVVAALGVPVVVVVVAADVVEGVVHGEFSQSLCSILLVV